jgi:hypothetical protein
VINKIEDGLRPLVLEGPGSQADSDTYLRLTPPFYAGLRVLKFHWKHAMLNSCFAQEGSAPSAIYESSLLEGESLPAFLLLGGVFLFVVVSRQTKKTLPLGFL